MLVRLALQVGVAAALATVMACGGATVTSPTDSGLQPCQDDQDCSRGYTCTGGFCQATTPVDAGPDTPQTPKMLVSPTLLDFGNAYVGGEFTKSFTIGNVGGATLTVTALNLVEDRTVGAFIVQSKPVPFTVDVAGSETVTVVLRPNDANLPTGSIKVHSDDPDPTSGSATVDLVSRSKGSPDLGICSINPTPPPDCQESSPGNAIIDYGTVEYGSTVERLVDLSNIGDGNLPIEVTEIYLTNPAHFTMALFELVDDPGNPGHKLERSVTLPFLLSTGDPTATPPVAPTLIRVHLGFSAVGIDGDVPHESLMVKDASAPSPTSVPIVGTIHGCIPVATDAGVPDGGADPMTDPNNCGTCGHVCVVAHGTAGCVTGSCVVAACDTGYADCNTLPGDGCERDLNTDPDACGGCVQACSNINMLTRTCGGGTCNGTCATGFADCNGNKLTDGCESELAIDPNNCSQCGMSCSNNHMATRTCGGGICNGTCAANYDDCDGNRQTNGCEIDLRTDTANCSACGNDCTPQLTGHAATAACQGGVCEVATCDSGYFDINGTFADGCECTATDSIANTCASAAQYAAPVTLTGNNLMPAGDVDWYRFTFSTNGTCIKPKIVITSGDPSIKMDVYTNCSSGTTLCSGSETSVGIRTWEVTYPSCADHDPAVDPVPDTGTFWQLPLVFYVKVYAAGTPTSCLAYTLAVTQ
ncbi:MAG: choice-of-anchor D domain-containing protein [Deltaproteobacteria bacterium]|nr:choice-of-anchor D domain-containing protein [Deltaproteobacteria bacterium]